MKNVIVQVVTLLAHFPPINSDDRVLTNPMINNLNLNQYATVRNCYKDRLQHRLYHYIIEICTVTLHHLSH